MTILKLLTENKVKTLLLCFFCCIAGVIDAQSSTLQANNPDLRASQRIEIYVSPNAALPCDGSRANPYSSLVQAQDHVRRLKNGGTRGEIIIYLMDGYHHLRETVAFDSSDSGRDNLTITWQAFPGHHPVITGNTRLANFQPAGNGIWKAKADFNFRQLYVDGRPAVRARTPDDSHFKLLKWDLENKVLLADPDIDIREMPDAGGVEMRMQHVWADTNLRLQSIRKNNSRMRIIPKEPERTLLFERSHPKKKTGLAFHFENAFEFLDQPGEFYLDQQEDTLYYKPRPGEDMESVRVEAPRLETLVSIQGTPDTPVKNLIFKGLTFEGSTWLKIDESGLLTLQAGMYNIKATPQNIQHAQRPPAAVYAAAADRIVFERCIFRNIGAAALDLHYGTNHCIVRGNVFTQIAGNGVQHAVFSWPDVEIHTAYNPKDPREICTCNKIENNYFSDIAWYYYGSVAIACGYPMGVEIEHNEITRTSYTGISVGWGWTARPNAMRQNKIRYNHLHHIMTMLGDGGAIYTLSAQPDSEIAYNYIHDVAPSEDVAHGRVKAIYLDECTDGYTVHHNAVYDAPYKYFRHRVGPNVIFHNNHRQLDFGIPEFDDMHLEELKANAGLEPEYKDIKKRME